MEGVREIINPEDNNSPNQDELEIMSTGRLFMNYFSKIIVSIYSYLQENNNKEIEALFSNAVDIFNALGSWIYGGASPKIIYPDLQLLVKKANNTPPESFSHLLDYINSISNQLYKILDENQWIQEHYYESFTLKQCNDVTTGLFFMWRLGWLKMKILEISDENCIPLFPHLHNAFDNLFDAFGGWIYHGEGMIKITQSFPEFEKLFREEHNPLYDEILEEANNTKKNIAKFLQKL